MSFVGMWQPEVSGTLLGTRTLGGIGSAIPSGTLYTLNSTGFTLIDPLDVGYFLSQGWVIAQTQAVTGSTNTVATIAALAALSIPAAGAATLVTDPLRGGTFVWSTLNRSTDVTNDPGQGVYVAPASATTGASGAWVRQYTGPASLAWFGAVGDGTTDNSVAFAKFGVYGRYIALLRGGIEIFVPPGSYNWDDNLAQSWLVNLGKMTFHAADTVWTNTQSGAGWPFPTFFKGIFDGTGTYQFSFIQQTAVGDTHFTLVTPSDASNGNYHVGQVVMLESIDTQGFGFPQNPQQFEYVTITAINASTGVISIKEFVRYQHRTDFPDFTQAFQAPCGAARVWPIQTKNWTVGDGAGGSYPLANGGTIDWDIDYSIIGPLTANPSPNGYMSLSGRRIYTYKFTCPGFSESITEQVRHEFNRATSPPIPDKCNSSITYIGAISEQTFQHQNPNDFVRMEDCKLGGIATGIVKNFRAVNCDFGSVGLGHAGEYGLSESQQFENCRVFLNSDAATINAPSVYDGAVPFVADGTNIIYANGVFSVLLTGTAIPWGSFVPGSYISWVAPSGFPGDTGVMRVLRTYQDATHINVVTDYPSATIPSWVVNNTFYHHRLNEVTFKSCTGSDIIRQWSDACENGFRYFERKRLVFAGLTGGVSNGYSLDLAGTLTRVVANVIKPAGNSSATTMNVNWSTFDPASNFAADSGGLSFDINIGVAGKRVLTQSAFTGIVGTDAVKLGGSPITALPARVVGGQWNWFTLLFSPTLQQAFVMELIMEYDCGQVRKLLPVQFAHGGDAIVGLTGLLP